jgi:hypothetical protein
MTSKKKTTAKKMPKASALSPDQKLAVIAEAIDRLPATSPHRLKDFAAWWTAFGLPEVMAFHEVHTDTAAIWLLRWNYSSGQPGGELQIDHAAIPPDEKQPPRYGSRFIRGRRYDNLFPIAVHQASLEAMECLKDWRRMLLSSQKDTTPNPTKEKKGRPFVRCLEHEDKEILLLAAALNGRPEGISRVAFAKEFLTSHRGGKVVITTQDANTILGTMDTYERRHRGKK